MLPIVPLVSTITCSGSIKNLHAYVSVGNPREYSCMVQSPHGLVTTARQLTMTVKGIMGVHRPICVSSSTPTAAL